MLEEVEAKVSIQAKGVGEGVGVGEPNDAAAVNLFPVEVSVSEKYPRVTLYEVNATRFRKIIIRNRFSFFMFKPIILVGF